MDPLSIVASSAGILAFCGKCVDSVGKFIVEAREVPDVLTTFYDTIVALQGSLQGLTEVLRDRPKPQPFERDHYANIHKIIQSCRAAVEKLDSQLPVLPTDPGSIAKARTTLVMSIKSSTIQQTINHISSYTQVLHLSLTTLSLGTLWGTQRSQNQIEVQIRDLTDNIRSANLVALRPDQDQVPENDPAFADANMTLRRNIQEWMQTADDIAAAISLHDQLPSDSGIDMGLESPDADEFDPEPEIEDTPSSEILQHQYNENQKLVQHLISYGILIKASVFQRKGIELKKRLAKACNIPFHFSERADMEEMLADILVDAETMDGRKEAKEILQNLLLDEVEQDVELRSEDRRCRLYHKLGRIAFDQNNVKTARRFFHRAFEGRRKIEPLPMDLVMESGDQLIKVLQVAQAFDEARGYMEWLRQNVRRSTAVSETLPVLAVPESPVPPSVDSGETTAFSTVFGWCKDNGFDVDHAGFCFDVCDSVRETSPLHLAVKNECVDIVQQMVDNSTCLEHRDSDFCTPLLLAATTRNHRLTRILLESGAKADVRDRSGRSPLHRCQASNGGVKVAELLLGYSRCLAPTVITARPEFINLVDQSAKTALYLACENSNEKMARYLLDNDANPDLAANHGKTALYMACEMGSEAMVQCLLEGQANPNLAGPGHCTPLLAAIEGAMPIHVKMHIIEMLLANGADARIPDSDGQDAFVAAKRHGFGSEIRKVLSTVEARRVSTISSTSASGSISSKASFPHQANSCRPRAGSVVPRPSRFSSVKWLRSYDEVDDGEVSPVTTSLSSDDKRLQS